MIFDSFILTFIAVLFLIYLLVVGFLIIFMKPKCTRCNSSEIFAFSEIKKYEIQDFHKCKKCGNVDFVNAGPRPEYYIKS